MSKCYGNFSLFVILFLISGSAYGSPQLAGASTEAPRRDLNGVWLGNAVMRLEPVPELTAWGKERFDAAKPFYGPRAIAVAESNDGFAVCDPLGFPRNIFYEMRAVEFSQSQNKMLMLFQYQRIFREIWTDGRNLPSNAGGDAPDSPDPRWYGYSVGRWVDDYTFVVNSTGFNESGWSDPDGHPRSVGARVEERYRRIDHGTLEVTVTIDDPVAYTRPFMAMKQVLRWSPKQEFEEQLCVPSEALEYLDTFRPDPGPAK